MIWREAVLRFFIAILKWTNNCYNLEKKFSKIRLCICREACFYARFSDLEIRKYSSWRESFSPALNIKISAWEDIIYLNMDKCNIFTRISQRAVIWTDLCQLSIKYRKSECGYRLSAKDEFAVRKSELGQLSITMFFCKALLSRPVFWQSWLAAADSLEIKLQRRKHFG